MRKKFYAEYILLGAEYCSQIFVLFQGFQFLYAQKQES